jgi:lysozyme family protein
VSLYFPRAHAITMHFEGSDRPDGGFVSADLARRIHDPGGATVFGMSQRALAGIDDDGDGRLDFDLDHDGDVDEDDLKILLAKKRGGDPKADELIDNFYRNRYWSPVRASEMVWPWCLLAYDAAVNHGVSAATLLLQRATGATPDGRPGPNTIAHVRTAGLARVASYVAHRGHLYARIYAKDTAKPILGWMSRLALLHEEALKA